MRRLDMVCAALLLGCGALAGCAPPAPPPAPAAGPPAAAPEQIYVVVERGQSLDAIAKAYHLTKQEIIAANKLTPPYTVKPGRVLAIPVVAGKPPPHPKKAVTKPKPTASAEADAPPERAAASPKPARPKRPPPEMIPLD